MQSISYPLKSMEEDNPSPKPKPKPNPNLSPSPSPDPDPSPSPSPSPDPDPSQVQSMEEDNEAAPPDTAEQQVEPAFWMTPVLELFAKLTGGAFCVPLPSTASDAALTGVKVCGTEGTLAALALAAPADGEAGTGAVPAAPGMINAPVSRAFWKLQQLIVEHLAAPGSFGQQHGKWWDAVVAARGCGLDLGSSPGWFTLTPTRTLVYS